MIGTEQLKAIHYIELREEIYEGLSCGMQIAHNGEQVEAKELEAVLILMEDSDYMREYVADQNGRIIKINYEQITQV